ncbi:MAG: DOMON-like domain-containing protein [Novosphingobium sp.]
MNQNANKPDRPELVQRRSFPLVAHVAHPAQRVTSVAVKLTLTAHWLSLRWRIEGAGALVVPGFAGKGRADELWRTTCFELFARGQGDEEYCEFNLSPSERWAAYDFDSYRAGMAPRPMPHDPGCTWRRSGETALFDAAIPRGAIPPTPNETGLTAVLEEEGGVISYWALAHPAAKPDFHNPAGFALTLA